MTAFSLNTFFFNMIELSMNTKLLNIDHPNFFSPRFFFMLPLDMRKRLTEKKCSESQKQRKQDSFLTFGEEREPERKPWLGLFLRLLGPNAV